MTKRSTTTRAEALYNAAGYSEYRTKRVAYVARGPGGYRVERTEPNDPYAIFFDGYLVWCQRGGEQPYFRNAQDVERLGPLDLLEVRREIRDALRRP